MLDRILVMVMKMASDLEASNTAFQAPYPAFVTGNNDSTSSNAKPASIDSTSSNALLMASSALEDITSTILIANPDNCEREINLNQQHACDNIRNTAHIFLNP